MLIRFFPLALLLPLAPLRDVSEQDNYLIKTASCAIKTNKATGPPGWSNTIRFGLPRHLVGCDFFIWMANWQSWNDLKFNKKN